MNDLSPIALFVYNRPEHTLRTLRSLARNKYAQSSKLFVFSDGPKESLAGDRELVETVRETCRNAKGFKEVVVVSREQNVGLAANIIYGTSNVFERHDKVVVLEDDMETSPCFLDYMNSSLVKYKNEDSVFSIHGYIYDIEGLPDSFFMKGSDCWGWATWRNRWSGFVEHFDSPDFSDFVLENGFKFDLSGAYPFTDLLLGSIYGENQSWAIRMHAYAYSKSLLGLFPGKTLVKNIGNDGSGVHSKKSKTCYTRKVYAKPARFPSEIVESGEAVGKIRQHLISNSERNGVTLKQKVKAALKAAFFKLRGQKRYSAFMKGVQWSGNHSNWDEAIRLTKSYADDATLNQLKEAALEVSKGGKPYERDGVVFDRILYSRGLAMHLLRLSMESGSSLRVLDFGGGAGSSYYQNRALLKSVNNLSWTIIEQPELALFGRENISEKGLLFHDDLDKVDSSPDDVFLISGVIQYLKEPSAILHKILARKPRCIIFDRTSFIRGTSHRLTVQKLPESLYEASYPCWFFNERQFEEALSGDYRLVDEFESFADPERLVDGEVVGYWKGKVFELR
jgi:putative methyltransferase (TIGR04325 family)